MTLVSFCESHLRTGDRGRDGVSVPVIVLRANVISLISEQGVHVVFFPNFVNLLGQLIRFGMIVFDSFVDNFQHIIDLIIQILVFFFCNFLLAFDD